MTNLTQSQSTGAPLDKPRGVRLSKSAGRRIRITITYFLLVAGGITMVFPLVWMLLASFKPEWQILTNPPIWIPSRWVTAQAGDTTKEIVLWHATDPDGEQQRVLNIGTRRYTTVVDVQALADQMVSVAPEDVSDAQARRWAMWSQCAPPQGRRAGRRPGARWEQSGRRARRELSPGPPADAAGSGQWRARANLEIGDYRFQAREVESGDHRHAAGAGRS